MRSSAEVDTTGFVLTKLDGDARGGAALSITAVTGKPVFFAGVGEKPEDLEEFHPDRMAGRIMGMGDVLSLIDKASEKLDAEEAKASAEKMLGGAFTLEDFLAQLRQMRSLGPIQDLLKMLPGMPGGKNAFKEIADQVDEGKLRQAEALILSMTPEERREPGIISGSRRLRIARGAGATTSDVNTLLKDFEGARKMMRSMMGGEGSAGHAVDAPDAEGAEAVASRATERRKEGTRDDDEDPAAEDGVEQAPVLPRRGGRPAQSPRWPVHREHRQVPPARRPQRDRDRPGPRPALAAGGRPAVGSGTQPDAEGRDLGRVREGAAVRRRRARQGARREAEAVQEGEAEGGGRRGPSAGEEAPVAEAAPVAEQAQSEEAPKAEPEVAEATAEEAVEAVEPQAEEPQAETAEETKAETAEEPAPGGDE